MASKDKQEAYAKGNTGQVDFEKHPAAQELLSTCQEFFDEIQHHTPGWELEDKLNREYGPGTHYFDTFEKFVRRGLEEGWMASEEITGREYRRSRVAQPSPQTRFFSISAVYMEGPKSGESRSFPDADDDEEQQTAKGQYHKHPYGEINMVLPIDPQAKLMGMRGWQGAGWTSPGAGTHHYPEVKGGGLVSFFFLPAGRITYDAVPGDPQPIAI